MIAGSHPILSCEAARAVETRLLGGDEAREWPAMQAAGQGIAAAVLADFAEVGGFNPAGRILVLAGKGHNGGDALIAAHAILRRYPAARAEVIWFFGERTARPLVARAWRELSQACPGRVGSGRQLPAGAAGYELCLDGVFGFQFRPPADARVAGLLERVNTLPIRLRAAVDLPSAGLFRADFTYATGSVKAPVVGAPEAGRVRYLDLGFLTDDAPGDQRVLTPALLAPLAGLRSSRTDKRSYGHLLVIGGSRSYPGAILLTVLAALRSGAGLVTAFVPESLAPAFAARAPGAMWVGCPETPDGGLALEGEHLVRARVARATALVLGPGMGREPETLALAASLVKTSPVPLVIDADALQSDVVRAGAAPRIVTPHAGEFARISVGGEWGQSTVVVLKGPVTRIGSGSALGPAAPGAGGRSRAGTRPTLYHSFFGGPVLARGGSGDLLAGLTGGLLAQEPRDPLLAAARGVVWHGRAADLLARAHGPVAVEITQWLDFLPAALRVAPTGDPGA